MPGSLLRTQPAPERQAGHAERLGDFVLRDLMHGPLVDRTSRVLTRRDRGRAARYARYRNWRTARRGCRCGRLRAARSRGFPRPRCARLRPSRTCRGSSWRRDPRRRRRSSARRHGPSPASPSRTSERSSSFSARWRGRFGDSRGRLTSVIKPGGAACACFATSDASGRLALMAAARAVLPALHAPADRSRLESPNAPHRAGPPRRRRPAIHSAPRGPPAAPRPGSPSDPR
jgi:hypothetical protein